MLLMDFSISSKWNVSAFQVTFFEMLSAWSASFLTDMTRISRGMNYRACKERRPCVGTFVSFRQGCLRNSESCSKFRTKPRILRPASEPAPNSASVFQEDNCFKSKLREALWTLAVVPFHPHKSSRE